jgi:hypothetical protein
MTKRRTTTQALPNRRKLTPKLLDSLEARSERYQITDTETPAIKVRITQNGRKTLSVLYKSPFTRKQARITLARWPDSASVDRVA